MHGRLTWNVKRLFDTVAELCREVGCQCLAERFAASFEQCSENSCTCGAFREGGRRPLIHLLAKLAPLTRTLLQLGYYDLALTTVEMAVSLEPTLDLDLARAYLHVVLGDTADASRIYSEVLARIGTIPPGELARLVQLAQTHAQEEDIAELVAQLKRFCAA